MARHSPFELQIEANAASGRITVAGELDIASVPKLDQAVTEILAEDVSELVIDLSGLRFVDSSGLRMFIVLDNRARTEGWKLVLIRPPEQAFAVFRISGAESSLPFVEESQSK